MNILISNLGSSVTDESLRATFATYGQVQSATIMRDGSQGATGIAAIIEMPDEGEARTAITRLHGAILDGSIIAVKEVVQIQPRSFSFLRGSIFNKNKL